MNCDAISYLCLVATIVALENFRFSCKAQYAIRVSPDVHSNARRFFFVDLRSQGRSPKDTIPLTSSFSFSSCRLSPGSQPGGMSKSRFRSFLQNYRTLYHIAPANCNSNFWGARITNAPRVSAAPSHRGHLQSVLRDETLLHRLFRA